MTEAWYMDDTCDDRRLPHKPDPPQYVTHEDLKKIGVLYWKLNPETVKTDGVLDGIKRDRGYTYEDCIECSSGKLPPGKMKEFYEEHHHKDEEVRLVIKGIGYFDVRDRDDRWIRIKMTPGDLIVLPAGLYHRFTVDMNDYIQAVRLFIGSPVWTAYNRATVEGIAA